MCVGLIPSLKPDHLAPACTAEWTAEGSTDETQICSMQYPECT